MGFMKMNLFRGVKISFIGLLVVRHWYPLLILVSSNAGGLLGDDGDAECGEVPGEGGDGGGDDAPEGEERPADPGAGNSSGRDVLSVQRPEVGEKEVRE